MKILSKKLNVQKKIATIKVQDKSGNKHTVKIVPCYESFEQYGAITDVLWFTMPIAEKLVRNKFKSI